MIPLRKQIELLVETIIRERQHQYDYLLPECDHIFLREAMAQELFDGIDKFVSGSHEHNPDATDELAFVNSVNGLIELRKEINDARFYLRLAQHQYGTHTKTT